MPSAPSHYPIHHAQDFTSRMTKKKRKLSKEHSSPNNNNNKKKSNNPLYQKQTAFLDTLSSQERDAFFSNTLVSADRRAELWMQQADLGEELVQEYAWATPDARALKVLRHFSPLIEIGCGAKAYWYRMMQSAGIDVVGYDADPNKGGSIRPKAETTVSSGPSKQADFQVRQGGPSVLKKHSNRTLFLCYPDEDNEHATLKHPDGTPMSLGSECLHYYKGTYVIHVGELFSDAPLAMDQAPWGRSSSREFQEQLAAQFHCVLHISLQSWLHVRDSLSVWKRSETCTLVFAAEDGEESDDEEIEFRYVNLKEILLVCFWKRSTQCNCDTS